MIPSKRECVHGAELNVQNLCQNCMQHNLQTTKHYIWRLAQFYYKTITLIVKAPRQRLGVVFSAYACLSGKRLSAYFL